MKKITEKYDISDAIRGEKLGLIYKKEKSTFRVFSTCDEVFLRLYENDDDILGIDYNMDYKGEGIFEITIPDDLNGKFYSYVVDKKYEITDPYSIASSINSKKSAIIDLEATNPEGWKEHKIPDVDKNRAIIYELHIKDFTFNENSGVRNRGKFLGLAEQDTNYNGFSTGLFHLKELGINYIHLMPVFDFLTVDEEPDRFLDDSNYNWGYDPELYNVLEGSYSTNPKCPENRIFEFKKMIMTLHQNGFKVIIDVVYNHLYRGENSNFEVLAPGYFIRRYDEKPSNGSGVGTEMDTEKPMYQKFILDSIEYWMKEYRVDGFRFDLMGLIDIETMKRIVERAKEIDKNVLIYGEPWVGGLSALDDKKRTVKGTQRGNSFACFNDVFRDCIKGDNNGGLLGFATGDTSKKICIETGIAGSIDYDSFHNGFTESPYESINYVNSHDDLILYDKIKKALPNIDEEECENRNKLALGIIFLSFGIPFITSGNEFLRSKNGIENTYNSSININQIDWSLKEKNNKFFKYIAELIELRKELKVFGTYDREEIKKNLYFIDLKNEPVIGFIINRGFDYLLIFHNSAKMNINIKIKEIIDLINLKEFTKIETEDICIEKLFDHDGRKTEIIDEDEIRICEIGSEVYRITGKM